MESTWARSVRVSGLVLALLSVGIADVATAERSRPRSQSIGLPSNGRLRHGVLLRPNEHVRYIGPRPPAEHFYGTTELVELLTVAATNVSERMPGARLVVGDLSRRDGGEIDGHNSHENGRDVDVAFYLVDARGRQYLPRRFLTVRPDGSVEGAPRGVRFDAARNWALIAALLENEATASVQYAFVAQELQPLLLAEGIRAGASPALLARAAMVLVQPSNGEPHRDHFHVRIYCPQGASAQCRDVSPYWPSLTALRRRLRGVV